MDQIAELLGSCSKFGKKCALLINPDHTLRFGLGRMLSSLAGTRDVDFAIFYNLNDAKKYLRE
jgi:hypothetical protein